MEQAVGEFQCSFHSAKTMVAVDIFTGILNSALKAKWQFLQEMV